MRKKIEAVLDRIRPALQYDGGDIELVKIDKKSKALFIRFTGTCDHCAISDITLKHLVEKEIFKSIPSITSVVTVT